MVSTISVDIDLVNSYKERCLIIICHMMHTNTSPPGISTEDNEMFKIDTGCFSWLQLSLRAELTVVLLSLGILTE